jgi:hypothetical protein
MKRNSSGPPSRNPVNPSGATSSASPNWTLIAIVAIAVVGIVAVVGMMKPNKVDVGYGEGQLKANFEHHATEAHAVPPKR